MHSPNFQICNIVAFFTVCLCNKLYSKHEIIWFPPDDQTINSDSHFLVCVLFVQFVSTSYILDDTVINSVRYRPQAQVINSACSRLFWILPVQDYSIQGPPPNPLLYQHSTAMLLNRRAFQKHKLKRNGFKSIHVYWWGETCMNIPVASRSSWKNVANQFCSRLRWCSSGLLNNLTPRIPK